MATVNQHPESTVRPKVGPGEPGYALGLAGFISSFIWGIAGIVLSAIGLSQSKKIGKANTFALAGLIIGIVQTVLVALAITGVVLATVWFVNYCNNNATSCQTGNGSNTFNYPQNSGQGQGQMMPNQTY